MTVALTQRLAEVVASSSGTELSEVVQERAKTAFLDTLGVMIAGAGEPSVVLLDETIGSTRGSLEASVILTDHRCDIKAAACINATAAHALDFDDVAFGGHLSAVVVPAALAAAEAKGCSGLELLRAYVAGYEVWSEISSRVRPLYHARGLHPTGLLGPIAAAAAAASVFGLNDRQTAMALSLGASQGAGLLANFGTMTKPFHAGRAAESGVMAAMLVANGYSSGLDGIEGKGGFLPAYSNPGEYNVEGDIFYLENGWRLETTIPNIKRYPVCYAAHRSIDAALEIRQSVAGDLTAIEKIEVSISERHSSILRYRTPTTLSEARFSIEFAVACALAKGWVGLSEVTEATLASPSVRMMMEKTVRNTAVDYDEKLDGFAVADRIVISVRGGETISSRPVERAIGHSDLPADTTEIGKKFFDCARYAGREVNAARFFETLNKLEALSDCRMLSRH